MTETGNCAKNSCFNIRHKNYATKNDDILKYYERMEFKSNAEHFNKPVEQKKISAGKFLKTEKINLVKSFFASNIL